MTCVSCGSQLPAGALICGECGRAVSSTTPVPSTPVPPTPAPATRTPVRDAVPSPAAMPVPIPKPNDTVQLDPFPWGLPPTATPASTEPVVDAPPVVVARTIGERFVLQFSTGESFTVTGTGLVGRNPGAEPGEYFDHSVSIADPGKSVSKTHLEFGQDDGVFWVSDRYSGNGTLARDPEGQPKRCEPGRRYRVARGGRVDIGDQFFVVS